MPTTADTTLADLVTAEPPAAGVLERFSIDFCCAGHRTLREACADAGVDPAGARRAGRPRRRRAPPVPARRAAPARGARGHFAAAEVDWTAHIPKLVAFWATRVLDVPGYEGNPVAAHHRVLDRRPFGGPELHRWLELWDEAVGELFAGERADLAKRRARGAAGAIGTLARRHAEGLARPQLLMGAPPP